MIRIDVTAEDVRAGVQGDCWHCPVARALARATDDMCANVFDDFGLLYLEANGRTLHAPEGVAEWVREFDANPTAPPGPFAFDLPPLDDPAWRARCDGCGARVAPAELDGDDLCEQCRDPPPAGG